MRSAPAAWRKSLASAGLAVLAAFAFGQPLLARPQAGSFAPLPDVLPQASPKTVDYQLVVALDEDGHTIRGTVRVRWRNDTPAATSELLWHVYNNAWAGRDSVFLEEGRLFGEDRLPRAWGSTTIASAHRVRDGELGEALPWAFVAQAGAPNDRTVLRTELPEPVAPGASVTAELAFTAVLPPAFRRSGADGKGGYVHAVQWYPKLGVFEELDGQYVWNCEPYRFLVEFYADYGDYLVELTLPLRYEDHLAATGTLAHKEVGESTVTYRLEAEDVHDFGWTADPDFVVLEREFVPTDAEWADPEEEARVAAALGRSVEDVRPTPTRMILMLQPEHGEYEEEYFESLGKSIYYFGLWYGSYPYPTISLIDPAHDARRTGGMEYPRLITGGVRKGNAPLTLSPEGVTVHEFGHQYWYGLVGNDEFRHAWLDEGLNTHSTGRVLRKGWPTPQQTYSVLGQQLYGRAPLALPSYGRRDARSVLTRERWESPDLEFVPALSFELTRRTSVGRWLAELPPVSYFPAISQDVVWNRRTTHDVDWSDALAQPTHDLLENRMRRVNAYSRPALLLETLAGLMGEARFTRVMRAFHERWRFAHPRPADFYAVLQEFATGAEVGPAAEAVPVDWPAVWRQSYEENAVLDYGVHRVENLPAVLDPQARPATRGLAEDRWDVVVELRRYGDFRVPVEFEIDWSDDSTTRHAWDGHRPWHRLTFEDSTLRALAVRVDPEQRLPLDANWLNNGRRAEPDRERGFHLGLRALLWAQQVLHHAGGAG